MKSDEESMFAVRNGDIEQISVLFERYHAALFDFFSRVTGNRTASQDLVQEVFLRILKHRETFRDGSHFKGWMYQIARNARADHFRKNRNDAEYSEREARTTHCKTEPDVRADLLRQAMWELPEAKRELLVLARYQGMTHDEIAALLNIEVGTVKVRIHRAMKELTEILLRLTSESVPCDVKKPGTILRTI